MQTSYIVTTVVYMPPLSAQDAEAAEKAIRSENLSMERLLVSFS
jgi:hypothetical protein